MTDRQLDRANALGLIGPAALLGGAFAFQYLGGLAPCEMCIWQRWPHGLAIAAALLALLLRRSPARRPLLLLTGLLVLASGAIGVYHAGVEQKWWQGVTACTAMPIAGSTSDIVGAVLATPLVRCDQIPWELFGISMAGYNAIFSALIGGVVLWLTFKRR